MTDEYRMTDDYLESLLHNLLAEDGRVAEQGIEVVRAHGGVTLVGEVGSAERRDMILRVVREALPDLDVHCDIGVTRTREPEDVEEL